MDEGFSVEVLLPRRRARSSAIGARRPRATVVARESGEELERIEVPLAAGKSLDAKLEAGEVAPCDLDSLRDLVGRLEERCCRARLEALINRRDYSRRELADKLRADGYPDELACGVLDRLEEVGLVSDARYADLFVRSKIASGWGRRKVEAELARRGVEARSLPGWPDTYFDEDSDFERALAIAGRRTFSGRDPYASIVRLLAGRGFSFDVARRVAERLTSEQ